MVGVFQIKADAKPTTVAIEEPITLTVTITGQAAATHVPKRENLRLFPDDMQRGFFIEPGADQVREGAWEFVYLLRPKNTRVQFVPSLKLVYFAARSRRYQTAYTDAIPLTVQERREAVVDIKGLKVIQAPASFYELTDKDTTDLGYRNTKALQSPQILISSLLGLPLLCFLGTCWWSRRLRKRLEQTRQHKRLVDQTIKALATPPCDAALISRLLTVYLRQRLDFPGIEPTPIEVDRWLKRRGISKKARDVWQEVLRGYDARRFAPGFGERLALDGLEAAELIQLLEDEPCVAGR